MLQRAERNRERQLGQPGHAERVCGRPGRRGRGRLEGRVCKVCRHVGRDHPEHPGPQSEVQPVRAGAEDVLRVRDRSGLPGRVLPVQRAVRQDSGRNSVLPPSVGDAGVEHLGQNDEGPVSASLDYV